MYTVKTLDTKATFVYDNGIILKSLILNGKERAIEHKIALPTKYICDAFNLAMPDLQPSKSGNMKYFDWAFHSARETDNGVDILLIDKYAKCRYLFSAKGRTDIAGPIEISGRLTNTGHYNVRIVPEDVFSAEFKFEGDVNTFHVMKESGVAENVKWHLDDKIFFPGTGIYEKPLLSEHTIWTSTNQDFNSGGMIPIMYLTQPQCGAYLALEWTSCRIKAKKTENGAILSADLREDFATNLKPGKEFNVPPMYLGVYEGDLDDGSNIFKRWFFLEKTPKSFLYDENEPYTQMDMQLDLDVKDLGIQSVKWDYGWWGANEDKIPTPKDDGGNYDIWKYYEGSWKLRSQNYKEALQRIGAKDMAEFGQKVKEAGLLNWTVYVLLHDSLTALSLGDELTSVGRNAHPEWFTGRLIGDRCPTADLGNEECVAYLKRKLYEFFTENNVRTWRSDFEPIARSSDKANRHDANGTDVQYWCSVGFYELVDYLIENIPGFRYESCSSGGSMKDYATMHRTCAFNNDDSSNNASLRTTFYDSTYCFPPAQLQAPTNPDTCCPDSEKFYQGVGDKDMGFRALIMGGVMLGSWSGDIDHKDFHYGLKDYYKKYLNLHNEKVKHLIRHANLYHILPRPDHINWDGMQYGMKEIPENRICGASFLFKPTAKAGVTKHIPVRGLNPDVTYKCEFYERENLSFVATGAELMEKGFDITINEDCGSEIVFFVAQ